MRRDELIKTALEMKDASIDLLKGIDEALMEVIAQLINGSAVDAFVNLCLLKETVEAGYQLLEDEEE
jgi:hypothetical protein